MKKVKKILDIQKSNTEYEQGFPVTASLMNIHHSFVHVHPSELELIMCIEGEVKVHCNHEEIILHEDEMFTVDYDDLHCVYSDKDNITLIMHLDYTRLGGLRPLYISCEDKSCRPFQKEMLKQVKCRILALSYRLFKGEMTPESAHKASVNLFQILEDNFNWLNLFETYQTKNAEIDKRLKKVFDYCNVNYSDKISASSLAKELHINENYFSQFFKKSTYGGFNKMLGYIRCYNAQKLLLESDMTITEIASACGFSDEKYFYKYFSYWWETTPSEFRKSYKAYIAEPDLVKDVTSEVEAGFESHMAEFFARTLT